MDNDQTNRAEKLKVNLFADDEELKKEEQERDQDFFSADPEFFQRLKSFVDCIDSDLSLMRERYPEVWKVLFDTKETEKFAATLTTEDFEKAFQGEKLPAFIMKSFSKDSGQREKLEALRYMTPRIIFILWDYKQHAGKKHYRTQKKTDGAAGPMPDYIPVITAPGYKYATSFYEGGEAYIKKVREEAMCKLQWDKKNQVLSFQGMETVTEARLREMGTNKEIDFIDLSFLKAIYGIIHTDFLDSNLQQAPGIIKKRVPDLAQYIGKKRNISQNDRQALINKMQQYQTIIGVKKIELGGGRTDYSLLPVLLFEGYDAEDDTISFNSPYLNKVIETVYCLSVRRDRRGNAILKKDGTPARLPSHTYLIKSKITKEANKRAVECVYIIVQVIETAGNHKPHISIKELINRNPQLKQAMEESTNKRQLIQRTIDKTLELLHTATRLEEYYPGIQIPDRKDPANIPNMSNLDHVLEFPHKGKKTAQEPKKTTRKTRRKKA